MKCYSEGCDNEVDYEVTGTYFCCSEHKELYAKRLGGNRRYSSMEAIQARCHEIALELRGDAPTMQELADVLGEPIVGNA